MRLVRRGAKGGIGRAVASVGRGTFRNMGFQGPRCTLVKGIETCLRPLLLLRGGKQILEGGGQELEDPTLPVPQSRAQACPQTSLCLLHLSDEKIRWIREWGALKGSYEKGHKDP